MSWFQKYSAKGRELGFFDDDSLRHPRQGQPAGLFAGQTQIDENDSNYFIVINLNGLDRRACRITVEGSVLQVRINQAKFAEEDGPGVNWKRLVRIFACQWELPQNADEEEMSFEVEKNLLISNVPKLS